MTKENTHNSADKTPLTAVFHTDSQPEKTETNKFKRLSVDEQGRVSPPYPESILRRL